MRSDHIYLFASRTQIIKVNQGEICGRVDRATDFELYVVISSVRDFKTDLIVLIKNWSVGLLSYFTLL